MTPDTPADGALAEAIAELPMVKPLRQCQTRSPIGAKMKTCTTGLRQGRR